MRSDLIIPGIQYVVSLKPEHCLIGETGITYVERLAQFPGAGRSHWQRERDPGFRALPQAALREYRRLEGALHRGLQSRIERCPTVTIDTNPISILPRNRRAIGTVCVVVEKLPKQRVLVEAEFRAQRPDAYSFFSEADNFCRQHFDPAMPEEMTDEEWETTWNGGLDDGGTLRAIVHQSSVRHVWSEDLPERLQREHEHEREEGNRMLREAVEAGRREHAEEHADQIVEEFLDETLAEANRPPDDEWEAIG